MTGGSRFSTVTALLLVASAAASSLPATPLRIEAASSAASVHYGQLFEVTVSIRNTSSETLVLQLDGCQLRWQWKANIPDVQVLHPAECRKNPIQYVRVVPGEAHTIRVSAGISAGGTAQTSRTVVFRLGCQPRLGYDLTAFAPYIWSNAVSVTRSSEQSPRNKPGPG